MADPNRSKTTRVNEVAALKFEANQGSDWKVEMVEPNIIKSQRDIP